MIPTALLDPQRYSVDSDKGPGGVLLLAMVNEAVTSIRSLRDRRKSDKAISPEQFQNLVRRAYTADLWLHGCRSRLTFRDVCIWHGFDEKAFRAQVYSQFDPAFIEWMRLAYEPIDAVLVSRHERKRDIQRLADRQAESPRHIYRPRKNKNRTAPPVSSPGTSNVTAPSVAEPQGECDV